MTLLIALAGSPFVVSALTGWIKGWTPFASLTDAARPTIVRALAAVLAFVYVVASMWFTGNVSPDVLNTAITALCLGVAPWLGSIGVFHAFFQQK